MRPALLTFCVLLAASCSGENESEPKPRPDVTPTRVHEAIEGTTVGGDGTPIALDYLTSADITGADLKGELGCSFVRTLSGPPIFLALADVGSDVQGTGVIKIGDLVRFAGAAGGPGFDAMAREGRFIGEGFGILIKKTGADAGKSAETPFYRARMILDRADGAQRTVEGFWACGP